MWYNGQVIKAEDAEERPRTWYTVNALMAEIRQMEDGDEIMFAAHDDDQRPSGQELL